MNNIFSLQRFLWLFNKHTKEYYKTYLISTAVLVGTLFIGMSWASKVGDGLFFEGQTVIFCFFLTFSGTIFTSSIFSDLADKKKAAIALTLPVSNLERFLVAWLYSFVIFQLIFILCFYGVGLVFLKIDAASGHHKELLNIWSNHTVRDVIFMFCVLHAVSFFGAVFFKKLNFIKTAFALLVFVFLLVLINKPVIAAMFNLNPISAFPFSNVVISENNSISYIDVIEASGSITTVLILLTTLILWVAAYFKLKEKQV